MIELNQLQFSYGSGTFQLKVPDLSIKNRERIAITGASGCGKTTFMNLLSGILLPTAGSVKVDGLHIDGLSDAARRKFRLMNIGYVFQEFELVEYLNVMDNILYTYKLNPSVKMDKTARERAEQLACKMGIQDKISRYPVELSQGEQQRVAICRAMITNPPYVFADEATGNLDPVNKSRILELLFRQLEESEATLLAITHDHNLLDMFDRTIDFDKITGS